MNNDLIGAIGRTLGAGSNQPGLAAPIFSYPGQSSTYPQSPYKASATPSVTNPNNYEDLLKQYLGLLNNATQQPIAPKYDVAAAQARARAAAEGAVNPLYTKRLTDFLAQQEVGKQRRIADVNTANQSLQDALQRTLENVQTAKTRTAEDTQANIDQTNNASDQFQADTGQAFDQSRIAQAAGQATSGLLGSGVGNKQAGQVQAARNTAEGRQATAFNVAKQQAETLKTRTFNDLNNQASTAQKQTGEATTKNNLDLARYIEDIGAQNEQQKQAFEAQRLNDIAQQQGGYYSNELANFYAGLSGPQLSAALAAYGR